MTEEYDIGDEVLKKLAEAKQEAEENEEEQPKTKGKKKGVDGRTITSKLNAAKARKTKLAKLKASKLAAEIEAMEDEYDDLKEQPKKKADPLELSEMKAEIAELKKLLLEKKKEETKQVKESTPPKPQTNDTAEYIKRRLINF